MPNEFVKVWRTQRDTSEGSPTNIKGRKIFTQRISFLVLGNFLVLIAHLFLS
jgi:hypothetical protein